jgi:hypothetical protein
MYSNVRRQNVNFFLVYLTKGALNGELVREKLTRHKWKQNGGGGRRKETKVKEKSNRIKNVDTVTYVIITNHSRCILLDAFKYTSKPDINV